MIDFSEPRTWRNIIIAVSIIVFVFSVWKLVEACYRFSEASGYQGAFVIGG